MEGSRYRILGDLEGNQEDNISAPRSEEINTMNQIPPTKESIPKEKGNRLNKGRQIEADMHPKKSNERRTPTMQDHAHAK